MTQEVPPPLFILCPLRSYSSLVCGMLGQHPQMYGMPELNLFLADTVDELIQWMRHRMPHGMDGLLRALAQIHDGEQTEQTVDAAWDWLHAHSSWTTKQVFDHLAEAVAPLILIDKSPAHVMRPDFLERMYACRPDASYLHLTRHPRPTGSSILKLLERNEEWDGRLKAHQVKPDRVWQTAHYNIRSFAATLPIAQCMRLKGEDLLANLDFYLAQIAEWLGLRTDAEALKAMRHPERSVYACRGPSNAEYGNDPNFLDHPQFTERSGPATEPSLEGPLDWAPDQVFDAAAIKLAREFGYR
jgi:hypothetical protein